MLLRNPLPRWALTAFLALCAFGSADGADRQFQVGVGTHVGDGTYPLQPTLAAIDALNVSVRDDVRWSGIERSAGKLEYHSGGNMDVLLQDVLKRNQRPIIELPGGNNLYDGGGQISSAAGIAAFARYARFVASQLPGRPKQIEVWNEWDHGSGSSAEQASGKGDPVAYANLLRGAYPALKGENPANIVIGGALATIDPSWIEKFAQAGGFKYLDAFSVHPYVHCATRAPQAPSHLKLSSFMPHNNGGNVRLALAEGTVKPIGGTPEHAIALLDDLKEMLDKYSPNRAIPVYVTEMGWPTSAGQCGIIDSAVAAYLQRFMLLAAARSYIAGVWWYDLFDDGSNPGNREHRFGLAAQDHQPKPAYTALLGLKDILNSSKLPTQTVGENGEIVVSGQQADGKSFYAAWIPTNNFTVSLAWPQGAKLSSSGFRRSPGAAAAGGTTISAVPTVMVAQ